MIFFFFLLCIPVAVSLCSEFLLVTCFALGVAVGKVGCTKLAPRPSEQDAHSKFHTFGHLGAVQGQVMLPCAARMCPVQCLAQGDSVLGQALEGGNVIYSNGSG